MTESNAALIIVDEQVDFCEGGSLAVPGGNQVCRDTARAITDGTFEDNGDIPVDLIVTSQDWHMTPGDHFSDTPDYVDTWPEHCVAGSRGARLHPAIDVEKFWNFRKGMTAPAYSAFEGIDNHFTALHWYLQDNDIQRVYVCGLALDYCVKATVLDAIKFGYETVLVGNLTRAVNQTEDHFDLLKELLVELDGKLTIQYA